MKDEPPTVTDSDMQALIDGDMSERRKNETLALIIRSPDLLARFEELEGQKSALKRWWACFKKDH